MIAAIALAGCASTGFTGEDTSQTGVAAFHVIDSATGVDPCAGGQDDMEASFTVDVIASGDALETGWDDDSFICVFGRDADGLARLELLSVGYSGSCGDSLLVESDGFNQPRSERRFDGAEAPEIGTVVATSATIGHRHARRLDGRLCRQNDRELVDYVHTFRVEAQPYVGETVILEFTVGSELNGVG